MAEQAKAVKISKQAWNRLSDHFLVEHVASIGPRQWDLISEFIKDRTGKQCRE